MSIICMFFPALISLMIEMNITHEKEFNLNQIVKYGVYTFIINFIGNLAVWSISSNKFYYYNVTTFNYDFCVKYMLVTLLVAVVLPFIKKILVDNFKIIVEVRKKDEKDNNHN